MLSNQRENNCKSLHVDPLVLLKQSDFLKVFIDKEQVEHAGINDLKLKEEWNMIVPINLILIVYLGNAASELEKDLFPGDLVLF